MDKNEINTRGDRKKKVKFHLKMLQNLNQDISDSTFSLIKIESKCLTF